ncbi:MAG: gas vesicle protein GvpD P-loop domain-containing protein [Thermoplasmata archaeon]
MSANEENVSKDRKKSESIPSEVISFLQRKGGSSLLLKGNAGTGKTTLALQLIEELGDPDKSFYLSTRVSDQSLYNQFPWLEEKEMKSRVIDSSKVFLEAMYGGKEIPEDEDLPEVEKKKIESAKEFLGSIEEDVVPNEVNRTRLNSLEERIPGLERIYDRIDHVLPKRCTLVVDSVEGLTHKYGIDPETFIMTLQKDLVEHSNTNVIMVLEKEKAKNLEYLVDGVVQLNRFQIENRDVREIKIIKLRAIGIQQPSYLMTLEGGRFRTFEPFSVKVDKKKEWTSVTTKEGYYSTGTSDLNDLLAGGFEVGSYNVFEVKEDVSNEEYLSVVRPIFLNFLAENRGVLTILSGGTHPENLRDDLTRFVSEDRFDSKFRVVDYFSPQSEKPYMMALGGKKRDEVGKIYTKNIREISDEGETPWMDYVGFDTMEYLTGNEIAIRDLLESVANTKASKNLGIGIMKHGLKLSSEIKNMADTYIVITSINNTPCIYGIKPKTGLYAIQPDEEKGSPHISLIPIR